MAGNFYNGKDSIDISELASLNDDISDDLIDQLQQKLTKNLSSETENDDSTLFEETENTPAANTQDDAQAETADESDNAGGFEDSFMQKYKAKLKSKALGGTVQEQTEEEQAQQQQETEKTEDVKTENTTEEKVRVIPVPNPAEAKSAESIEALSQGNITERPVTKEQKEYNDSLDFIDGNVKYSKYVIYIDPQNVDFIEGLTVKERKNLINGILRQQDDITTAKQKFKVVQTIIVHVLIVLIVFAISLPLIYWLFNASLEATIDNYRRSETNWQQLYKEHGKITKTRR